MDIPSTDVAQHEVGSDCPSLNGRSTDRCAYQPISMAGIDRVGIILVYTDCHVEVRVGTDQI
jgi:hypothetical protein